MDEGMNPQSARDKSNSISAGLLMYRRHEEGLEVFLAHPGGPIWKNRDAGAWTIPKGLVDEGEAPLAAARREFEEETGFSPDGPFLELGAVRQKAGKTVHAWAVEGNVNSAEVKSNLAKMEFPRGSGNWLTFPEVDRCDWFSAELARTKINPAQAELIDRLERLLGR
jgi:predicted NUDIX family NTP pyrophosphohydrolase